MIFKKSMPLHSSGQKGWTLLEILITVVLFGVGVAVFMRMQNGSWQISTGNTRLFRAGEVVQEHIESMKAFISRDTSVNWPPQNFSEDKVGLHIARIVSPALSPADGKVLSNVRKIDITVSWGPTKMDTLLVTTYVTKTF